MDATTTALYPLSLHDALPIYLLGAQSDLSKCRENFCNLAGTDFNHHNISRDRKSTRLNSSHPSISYAVFCLNKTSRIARDVSLSRCYLRDDRRPTPQAKRTNA